jgi:hypothetical protein
LWVLPPNGTPSHADDLLARYLRVVMRFDGDVIRGMKSMFTRLAAAVIALCLTCFQAYGLTSLTSSVNICVDGANGKDSNSGLSSTSAWKTFAPFYNYLCFQTFGNGFGAFIQVANASSISGAGGIGGMFYLSCTPLGYAYIVLHLGGGTLIPAPGYDAVAVATEWHRYCGQRH